MEPSNEIRNDTASNKLSAVEKLRIGHGLLNKAQFYKAVADGDLEVWALPKDAYALIAWGVCEHGETCNILTVTGDAPEAAESGLLAIEQLARARGARVIITVGRPGWKPLLSSHGYTVVPKILAKKVLES